MDPVIIEEKINDKIVRCIFIFKKYSAKEFKEDFDEFVEYQKPSRTTVGNIEHKMYREIKEFTEIPFEYFVEYATKLFSRAIFYMLKQKSDFIVSDELNIQISFKRIPEQDYYFETVEKSINAENACFVGAGMWFINNIVAPFFYLRKYDFTIITRYFLHELTHYVDIVKSSTVSFEGSKYEQKIRDRVARKSAYGINYLYSTLFNLRDEGLAEFVNRAESPEIELSIAPINRYNQNLQKLAFMRYKKDAERFYIDKIGYCNLSPDGEYAIGRNMCLIICLALAKKERSPYIIRINKDKFFGFEFDKLDHYLSYDAKIYVSDLKKDMVAKAIETIRPTMHYYFLKLYEDACDVLGISEANRSMTRRRFYELVKKSKQVSKDRNRRLVEKEGFIYIQTELETP